jgi:hypothetical protein
LLAAALIHRTSAGTHCLDLPSRSRFGRKTLSQPRLANLVREAQDWNGAQAIAMGTIQDLFRATAFDPETVKTLCDAYDKTLCDAYDKARKSPHDTGQPPIVNEIIAQRIIALAQQGERDPDRLCAGALSALGNKAVFER